MAKVYDCFSFFNELDLLEIRLNELNDVVDVFVLVEATRTFQNKPKDLIFEKNKERFARFLPKIRHVVVDKYPTFFTRFRRTKTWDFERNQRDFVSKGLTDCQPDDLILLSDVDEIPRKEAIEKAKSLPYLKVFRQKMFYYYVNCFVYDYNEPIEYCAEGYMPWHGSIAVHYKDFTNFEDLRTSRNQKKTKRSFIENGGWHYSWLGGVDRVLQKLDAYSHQEHNTEANRSPERIRELISSGGDLFGTGIKTKIVDPLADCPDYLRTHLQNYPDFVLK
nr:benzoate transporter [Bdellovibrio sp. HAGR004]